MTIVDKLDHNLVMIVQLQCNLVMLVDELDRNLVMLVAG